MTQRRVIKRNTTSTPEPMTQIELLSERWACIQEARLKEMQEIAKRTDAREHYALVEILNSDPFWEHIFDLLPAAVAAGMLGAIAEDDIPRLDGRPHATLANT